MEFILATQYDGAILGPVARVLGAIMNVIFDFCEVIGIPNIGLAIILFTIIINLLILPLTIKQQKFSKMNAVMAPELQKITAKYKGKTDQDSMLKQQEEQRAVYRKYGVSQTAGCLPLLIQMPILLALYRVIYNIPGYVDSIKSVLMTIVDSAITQGDFVSKISDLASANGMSVDKYLLDGSTVESKNYIVDLFYKFDRTEWSQFTDIFPNIASQVQPNIDKFLHMNSFLGGINLAEAPGFKISIALVIPLLAWLTQWLSTKLMTAVNTNPNVEDNQMANTMKGMNNIMPIMSAIFCITLPAALGIYWIAGAVVRITQQLGINAFMNKMTAEDIIAKNLEKQNKKRAKKGLPPLKSLADDKDSKKSSLTSRFAGQQQDTTNTPKKNMPTKKSSRVDSSEYYKGQNVKQGGIASKARMVTDHDQKSVKKK